MGCVIRIANQKICFFINQTLLELLLCKSEILREGTFKHILNLFYDKWLINSDIFYAVLRATLGFLDPVETSWALDKVSQILLHCAQGGSSEGSLSCKYLPRHRAPILRICRILGEGTSDTYCIKRLWLDAKNQNCAFPLATLNPIYICKRLFCFVKKWLWNVRHNHYNNCPC